ncbi:MAG: paraquat-inducible protein A, partial [Syntrophales bacterium]
MSSGTGIDQTLEENRISRLSGNLMACPDCDLLQSIPALPPGGKARCSRCGHIVASSKVDSLDRTLALTVTAAIVLIIANTTSLMGLSAVGREASTTILGGALEMWLQGQEITALLVAFCAVIAPAIHIGFMLTVLLATRRYPAPWWVGTLLRWSEWHEGW